MGKWHVVAAGLAVVAVSTPSLAEHSRAQDAIVGVWLVEHPTAPFPLHLYVFNADHTMQQANPDAGNPRSSDSDGKGVWTRRGDRITGKWVEIIADPTTHKLSGRGELTFEIVLSGDRLTGKGTFLLYDPAGARTGDAIDAPFTGTRVKAP